jgi:hypothetical protein
MPATKEQHAHREAGGTYTSGRGVDDTEGQTGCLNIMLVSTTLAKHGCSVM